MRDPHSAEEWQECWQRARERFRDHLEREAWKPTHRPLPAPSRLWRGVAWGLGITAFCAIWWFVLATAR